MSTSMLHTAADPNTRCSTCLLYGARTSLDASSSYVSYCGHLQVDVIVPTGTSLKALSTRR
jgi:hypothetical protein